MKTLETVLSEIHTHFPKWNAQQYDNRIVRLNGSSHFLTEGDLRGGVMILGQPGSGKSRVLRHFFEYCLLAQMGHVFFATSGVDAECALISCIKADLFPKGHVLPDGHTVGADEADVHVVGFGQDDARINIFDDAPLAAGIYQSTSGYIATVEQLLIAAASVIDPRLPEDDCLLRVANQVTRSLLTLLYGANEKLDIDSIVEALNSISDKDAIDCLANRALRATEGKPVAQQEIRWAAMFLLNEYRDIAPHTTSAVEFTLASTFDALQREPLRGLLCSETTVRPELVRAGEAFIVNVDEKQWGQLGKIAAVILHRTFQGAALWHRAGEAVAFWMDDYPRIASLKHDLDAFSVGHASRVINVVTAPRIGNLGGIAHVFRTHVYLQSNDPDTVQWIVARPFIQQCYSTKQWLTAADLAGLKNGGVNHDGVVSGFVYRMGQAWSKGRGVLLTEIGDAPPKKRTIWHRLLNQLNEILG